MRYYKAEAEVYGTGTDGEKRERLYTEKHGKDAEYLIDSFGDGNYAFIFGEEGNKVCAWMVIAENVETDVYQRFQRLYESAGYETLRIHLQEILYGEIFHVVNGFMRGVSGVWDGESAFPDASLWEKSVIDDFPGTEIREKLIRNEIWDVIYEKAAGIGCDSLTGELYRICAGCGNDDSEGPVCYIVEADGKTAGRITEVILQALYVNKKLSNRRCCEIGMKAGSYFPLFQSVRLYYMMSGGAVVLDFSEDTAIAGCNGNSNEKIDSFAQLFRVVGNSVLSVVILPSGCSDAKKYLYEKLDNARIVEIQQCS